MPALESHRPRNTGAIALVTLATTATLLVLDLTWLGVVARGVYDASLAPLKRPVVFLPAVGLFYALYVVAVVRHAVLGASSVAEAARRGAGLGLVAYGTYELTNWAVLRDWPSLLVPIDICWGIALTGLAAMVGKLVHQKLSAGSPR